MKDTLLRALYAQNFIAQKFFDRQIELRRSLRTLSLAEVVGIVRRIGFLVAPDDVRNFFRALEEADCGTYLRDENGERFVWIVKARDAAEIARSKGPMEAKNDTDARIAAVAMLPYSFRLRQKLQLEFSLPADLSRREVERLCYFFQSLPIEE